MKYILFAVFVLSFVFYMNAEAASSVTVTSPNGGETLKIGNTYNVTWAHQNVYFVYIYLMSNDTATAGSVGELYTNTDSNAGSYSWTIPSWVVPGSYKILISAYQVGGENISDLSNSFFTIAPTDMPTVDIKAYSENMSPTPWDGPMNVQGKVYISWEAKNVNSCTASGGWPGFEGAKSLVGAVTISAPSSGKYTITMTCTDGVKTANDNITLNAISLIVTSPNGGEKLEGGKDFQIRWNSDGLNSRPSIGILLLDSRYTNQAATIEYIAPNPGTITKSGGTYNWKVPSSISNFTNRNLIPPSGKWIFDGSATYSIHITAADGDTRASDQSDAPFSIAGSSTTLNTSPIPPSSSASSPAPAMTFTPQTLPQLIGPFSFGMRSEQVRILQQYLNTDDSIGFPASNIASYYGPATKAAVTRFQAQHNIEQTGLAGSITRAKLNTLYGYSGTQTNQIQPAANVASMTEAQKQALIQQLRQQLAVLTQQLQEILKASGR